MSNSENNLCKGCKHFVLEMDADGPGIPWCGNPKTKKLDHPIGWLNSGAKACQLFETVKVDNSVSIQALTSQQETSARKEHWSSSIIKVCLCLAFLKFAFIGNVEMTYKLGLVLLIAGTAKEVTANIMKGSIKLSR